MPKPIIAVDIDDVLAANAEGFVKFSNKRWGTNLTIDDYDEHWGKVWQVDQQEWEKRNEDYVNLRVMRTYRHFDEAKPVLKKLNSRYKLVIVTSRRIQQKADTLDWIKRYFKDTFEEIYFSGIWDKIQHSANDVTKLDMIKQLKVNYLIDDQPKHCFAATEAGITALLFGDYKWNHNIELKPRMIRAKNWQEVLEYFDAES
ncbi:MAG: hypothetical protein AAB541_04045 [Patescibacteria group bacterium]